MKKKLLFLLLMLAFTFTACNSGGSSSSSKTEFTSEQDVKNFCRGKSFSIPQLGSRSTNNDSDIDVRSYSGNTATVRIYFDFAGDKLGANFRVNKETGDYEWFR